MLDIVQHLGTRGGDFREAIGARRLAPLDKLGRALAGKFRHAGHLAHAANQLR
jgi:hypothetical protein